MEISLNKKSPVEGSIKIKLMEGDYLPHVEEKLKGYAKNAQIKGFRPGKVPTGIIKKMYGKSVLVDEVNHLVYHKLSDYIRENKINMLGDFIPKHNPSIDWDAQKEFEFEYEIGMYEDFKYNLSPEVKIKSHRIRVEEAEVEETIKGMQERFGRFAERDTIEAGSYLSGDLKPKDQDSAPLETYFWVKDVKEDGQGKFIGAKVDEAIAIDIQLFEASFVARLLNIKEEEAAQKTGPYIFTVKTIKTPEPAPIDQELFDQTFGKDAVKTEEEYRVKIKETITGNYQRETDHLLTYSIRDHYVKNTPIVLPETFLKSWMKTLGENPVSDETIEKEFGDYKEGMIWTIIKDNISRDHSLEVTPEEVFYQAKEQFIGQLNFGGAISEELNKRIDEVVIKWLEEKEGKNYYPLFNKIKESKVFDLIKQKITLDETEVSLDEFKKIAEDLTQKEG